MLITVLPPWLNLDSFSIIRLSSLIVSLSIAVYLFKIKGKSIPTLLLAWTFTGGAIFNLSTFLEFASPYYWQPYNPKNLIIQFLLVLGPSIITVSLLLFAYYFPHFQKPDRREFRIVFLLAVLANLATLGLTFYNFVILERMSSYFGFRMLYSILLYISSALQFILVVFLLFRKAVRFSSGRSHSVWLRLIKPQGKNARVAWSLALVLLLPLLAVCGYILNTLGVLPPTVATYIVWLVFLLFYFSFVVTYLNHTDEPTTFQVKLVGVVLVLVVAILGLVGIIVGGSYKNDCFNEDLVSDQQTIHFALNRHASYDISKATYRFDSSLGSKIEPGYGERERLELQFPFPFFDQVFKEIHLLHGPMIYLGDEIREDGWGGYHPQPAIAPMIMNVEPARGGGIFYKSEPESMTITWYEVPEFGHDNSNTIQLVLFKYGSFDFTYRELNIETGYSATQMYVYTTANLTGLDPGAGTKSVPSGPKLVGIHSGSEGAALQPVRFSRGLPYSSDSPGVIFEAYDIDFYHYLHNRMSLLVLILVASCIFVLFFFPFLFKTSLIKPLQALYEGMQRADSGDLDVSVSPQFNDEIGFLTEYFNHMLQSIKKAEEALRQSEETLRGFMDSATDGFTLWDAEFNLIEINEAGIKLFPPGTKKENIIGKNALDIIPDIRETAKYDKYIEVIKIGKPFFIDDFISHRKFGDIHLAVKVFKVGDGLGMITMDITERKKTEEQIKASLKEKEVLLQEIHHRVRNNMQVVSSLLKLQAGKMKDEKVREAFKESQRRVSSMALVHETLYRSKSMAEIELQKHIPALVKSVSRTFRARQKIDLKMDIDDIKLNISQATPLSLVINELVSNSFKHAFPEGKGEIAINVRLRGDDEIEVVVSDNGRSMPEDIDSDRTLGLQLVTGLVESQLRGTWDRKGGEGTKHTIRFKKKGWTSLSRPLDYRPIRY